jgi:two-component system response regulator AtoC
MQLLNCMKEQGVGTLPIMITAFGSVEQAVEAMRIGAYDFLMKPFSPEQVELIIKRARELVSLQAENIYLKEELGWILPRGRQIVGQSDPVQQLMKEVQRVARSASTVLVTGESGTGKELVALAIHSLSGRADQPFVRMNCAAVPDTLMDSELFGHEKGSFTSAVTRRIGRFELANRGTLLLDEVSEMNLGVQSKLLRVLQEQEFERVGGSHTIKTDVRLIATSNRDLRQEVEDGNFRQDLYYRLNVVPIVVPPLRERAQDIPLLAQSFIERYTPAVEDGERIPGFSAEAIELMGKYSWPGNVRELENLVERLCVMEDSRVFTPGMLPPEMRNGHASPEVFSRPVVQEQAAVTAEATFNIAEVERRTIMQVLDHTGGNRRQSAELLGISIRTLRNKLNQYRDAGLLTVEL